MWSMNDPKLQKCLQEAADCLYQADNLSCVHDPHLSSR
jgi:hypothetical protein